MRQFLLIAGSFRILFAKARKRRQAHIASEGLFEKSGRFGRNMEEFFTLICAIYLCFTPVWTFPARRMIRRFRGWTVALLVIFNQ